jgi:hypothetical protein
VDFVITDLLSGDVRIVKNIEPVDLLGAMAALPDVLTLISHGFEVRRVTKDVMIPPSKLS